MGARFWLEFGLGPQGFAPIPQGFTGAVGWVPNQPTQLIPNRLGRCMPDLRKARVKTQAIRIPLLVRGWCEPCRRLEEESRGPEIPNCTVSVAIEGRGRGRVHRAEVRSTLAGLSNY